MRTLILPAAGRASRIGGIPKFSLPCEDDGATLLSRHVRLALDSFDQILIPTRTVYVELLGFLVPDQPKVSVIDVGDTNTMCETVLACSSRISPGLICVGMPDTYFSDESVYANLMACSSGSNVTVSIFATRKSQLGKLGGVMLDKSKKKVIDSKDKCVSEGYSHHWGLMRFGSQYLAKLDPTWPHVGYLLNSQLSEFPDAVCEDSQYFDCGTFSEYAELIEYLQATTSAH